jgi:TonB family protein
VCARDPLSPGPELPADAIASGEPEFTPYTVKPDLKNPAQVAAALRRNYPPLLRDAGIAGTTVLWFHIGADGAVLRTTLKESSGYPALDESAARVAETMEFTPALNEGRPTAVWVMIPLTFASSGPQENDTESPRTQIRATPVPPPVEAPSSSGPTFTPYTVKPALRDAAGVSRALQRNYPPLLRDAGIGGTASVWFHISATGSVEDVRIAHSSGFDALDEAALSVARVMTFDPAVNRDKAVEVWVQIPITFSSK